MFLRLLAPLVLFHAAAAGISAAEPRVGERWAVLIGVDDYAHANDLRYCGADQTALRERLIAAGFPPDNVLLLHDKAADSRYRPTQRNIEQQLRLVIGSAEADDLLVVGFSGHGVSLSGKSYLCPNDATLGDPATLVSLDDIYEQLRGCAARFKWVLVDACRNDPTLGGARSFTASEGTKQLARSLQEMRLPEGVVLLNSCAPGEISWEEEQFGHGVYMHFVLEGMAGAADADADGAVSLNELQRYAGGRTKSYVIGKFTAAQRPFYRSEGESETMDFALLPVRGLVKPTTTTTQSLPPTPPVSAPLPAGGSSPNSTPSSTVESSVPLQFAGIGIQLWHENGLLKVMSPVVGGPAYVAGLEAGDVILEIDGKSTENLSLEDAVKLMKGEPGTSVKLTVAYSDDKRRETLTIERQIVKLETVLGDRRDEADKWIFMLDPEKRIGYIRVTSFGSDTAEVLETALQQLKNQGLKGLVLDLRFNTGGPLDSAIDVSDLFIAEGTIVNIKGRNTAERTVTARKPGTYEGFPIAVLVNRFSAGAGEVVAACLQDHQRAVVVGERTWGKGSFESDSETEGGLYIRPSGQNIHRDPDAKDTDVWGVMPDKGYDLRLSDDELRELVRVRRDRDVLLVSHSPGVKRRRTIAEPDEPAATNTAGAKSPADPIDTKTFVDRQLQKALEYVVGPSGN